MFIPLIISFLYSFTCKITVHVLPHSHDDPGWIKTFDEYYYNRSVIDILSNTIISLTHNPNRTFIYSEISFFKKWYLNQTDKVKEQVKSLIKEGRLDIVNGGYVMEDSAACNYIDAITQLRYGLEFVYDEFGIIPHIGWFLDQFGHSASHGNIYSQFDFDYVVINRISKTNKTELISQRNLEHFWTPLNTKKEIFTHIIHDYFVPPPSIVRFVDDKPIDFIKKNISKYAEEFAKEVRNAVKGYLHDDYVLYYGNDFSYTKVDINYENIEKLMEYVNNNIPDIEMKYSTPERYFKETSKLLEKYKPNMMRFKEDYLPYVDEYKLIWTGYFTSRPYLKGRIRESSQLLSLSSKFFFDYMLLKKNIKLKDIYQQIKPLLEAVSITQHHDAITGTAKTYVSDDYMNMLDKGEDNLTNLIQNSLNDTTIEICLSNGKVKLGCNLTNLNNNMVFNVYNPYSDSHFNRLFTFEGPTLLENFTFDIVNKDNMNITYDKYCIDSHKCYIHFFYFFEPHQSYEIFTISNIKEATPIQRTSINSLNYNTNLLSETSYEVSSIMYDYMNNTISIIKDETVYNISLAHGMFIGVRTGAYIFNSKQTIPYKDRVNVTHSYFINNTLSSALYLNFNNSTMLITFFNSPFFIHLINVLNPVDLPVKYNGEVILEINTEIKSNGFYHDSTGMKLMYRSFNSNSTKQTGEYFYPIGREISIKDEKNTLSLYNDRPQAGTSKEPGVIYMIMNRWSIRDDYKGLDERLYEPQSTSVKYDNKMILVINNNSKAKKIADDYFNSPFLIFKTKKNQIKTSFNSIKEYFICDEDIKMEVQIISDKRVIVQFYNSNENITERVSIEKNRNIQLSLCDVNGFNCQEVWNQLPKYFLREKNDSNYLNIDIEPTIIKAFEIIFKYN